MGDPYKSSGKHRAAKRATAGRAVARPDDTDETAPVSPPAPEHTLREVLADQELDTAVAVAADKLLEEIAERSRAQEGRIAELERGESLWRRARAVVGTVSAAGVLSALAVVAAQLISHGDARAEGRQQASQIIRHASQLEELRDQIDKLRLQVTADHTLLQFCAARLGATLQGVP